jgi:Ca2+-binding EF-hand superfamily protein
MITQEDVVNVATSMNAEVTEEEVYYILNNYIDMTDETMTWEDSVRVLIHHIKSQWNE